LDRISQRIVAEFHGKISGSVLLFPLATAADVRPLNQRAELRLLAVLPEARGRGIGAALVSEEIGRARQSGTTALDLYTFEIMAVAIGLYERFGFYRLPDHDIESAPGLVALAYRLDITS